MITETILKESKHTVLIDLVKLKLRLTYEKETLLKAQSRLEEIEEELNNLSPAVETALTARNAVYENKLTLEDLNERLITLRPIDLPKEPVKLNERLKESP